VSRGIAVLFLGPRHTRWGWGVSHTPRLPLPPGKTQYPLYSRVTGLHFTLNLWEGHYFIWRIVLVTSNTERINRRYSPSVKVPAIYLNELHMILRFCLIYWKSAVKVLLSTLQLRSGCTYRTYSRCWKLSSSPPNTVSKKHFVHSNSKTCRWSWRHNNLTDLPAPRVRPLYQCP